ncbi:hypothetical protein H1R20_g1463, partial [Candolleomyces eurysporus]
MRFLAAFFIAVLYWATTITAAPAIIKPFKVCDPTAKGPFLRQRQEAALKDFAKLFLIDKNPKAAFDKYIPGEYIQHNPDALSGREVAIEYLITLQATPGLVYSNITLISGNGLGLLHYRRKSVQADMDMAIMDRMGFKGTCMNEHWDVRQRIYGNETNPLAFF